MYLQPGGTITLQFITQSLDELEGVQANGLPLRSKPVQDYSIPDLCYMIAQQQGLAYLVPVALLNLVHQPFVADGELLLQLLKLDDTFWAQHPNFKTTLNRVVTFAKSQLETINVADELKQLIAEY